MQKLSSFGRKEEKQTKIRHRMDMLRRLQFVFLQCIASLTECFLGKGHTGRQIKQVTDSTSIHVLQVLVA